MTEPEWQAATDPLLMLAWVRDRTSERKLRLLGAAGLRASWDRLVDVRSRRAVEAAERFADGKMDAADLEIVVSEAWDVRDEFWDAGLADQDDRIRMWLAGAAAFVASDREWRAFRRPIRLTDYPFWPPPPAHCEIIRDIVGPLAFRPVTFAPASRTPTIVSLAESAYADHACDRLPILADALEEAGCHDPDILMHCRSSGPHVRGCWVVDLLLGKS